MRLFLLTACLLSAACRPTSTQISNSGKGAYEIALTRAANGFVVAWYDIRDGNAEIYMRALDTDGKPAGPERRLTNGPEDSYEASIDHLDEAVVVAWYDQSVKGRQIAKLGVWNRDGSNRWVRTFAEGTRNPIVQTKDRSIFCAWIQVEEDGREAVFSAWWDSDGQPRGVPLRLGPASKTTWNVNAAIDPMGVAWVVFDAAVSTRSDELYAARADATGTGAVRITTDDGASSKYPDLAIGANGEAALAWHDERDGNAEVYLLTGRLTDLTTEIDGRSRRVTTTPGESTGTYLAWNRDRLGLAWSDKIGGQDEIFFQSFEASGIPRGSAQRLTNNATWSLVPAIQPWHDGFALAWNEYAPASVEIHVGTSEAFFVSVP